ncbi:MAG TPA: alginate lyase family protein, partial [Anaerolineales bacterium]|nr:alginate lyase family protein [Anaerolineales bacterium]
ATKKGLQRLLGRQTKQILTEADEILQGRVRLFGAEPRKLVLALPGIQQHWTRYHDRLPNGADIKPLWEAGRFGWATVLARAYWLSGDERYAEGFWSYFEKFNAANPPHLGPHWSSAQEVALRLISWAFCYNLLAAASSSTPARKILLARSVAQHAERIPPSLEYARAQGNNHYLSEALGLCTAAALLPQHAQAQKWKIVGWAAFIEGVQKQVHADGAYAQHSSNYHRLLLQLGLWAGVLARNSGDRLPRGTLRKLGLATDWLLALLDQESGMVPNLGPNDGAHALPLSVLPFSDYRPVLQAASLSFKGASALPAGLWNDLALWLGLTPLKRKAQTKRGATPLRLEGKRSWAYFRAAEFQERPGHADQLHVDLWWRGLNLALDPGSYRYTAPAPWDNALASAKVHNTITVNGRDPMTRAGRFLWLDWARAELLATRVDSKGRLVFAAAQHNGYAKLGLLHRREVSAEARGWVIADHLEPIEEPRQVGARLQWLLPDWRWSFKAQELRLASPRGTVRLKLTTSAAKGAKFSIVRAGKVIYGRGPADAVLGWVSPTYEVKLPALSFNIDVISTAPFTITSTWTLPK